MSATGQVAVLLGNGGDYAIDQASGALAPLQKYPVGKGANWVEIVSLD